MLSGTSVILTRATRCRISEDTIFHFDMYNNLETSLGLGPSTDGYSHSAVSRGPGTPNLGSSFT
jgi:hypothetical protein